MKLRTYLVKRTIHMIITMLIVLVLLFVLYRMMPGSAAAQLMMKPGMTQSEIDMVMVRYGFGKWADYPGEYVTRQFEVEQIGRYTVYVNAGETGNTDTFVIDIDVNTPSDADMVPPIIMDMGFEGPPPSVGEPATFYAVVSDESGIRTMNGRLVYPTSMPEDPTQKVTKTLMFREDPARSNESARTYYYNFTTEALVSGPSNSIYSLTIEAIDYARNSAFAALTYDADSNTITTQIWNLNTNVDYTNGLYTYPYMGNSLGLSADVISVTPPVFSIIRPNGAQSATAPVMVETTPGSGIYDGSYQTTENGKLTFNVAADGLTTNISFPVNSPITSLTTVQDDDSGYPLLTELSIGYADLRHSGYPFELEGNSVTLRINATITEADGTRSSNISATILMPNGDILGGGDATLHLTHPIYVQMRSMAEQFVIYMKTMLVFDFGTSFHYNQPVWDVIIDRIPSTALLFGTSLVLSYIFGILIGVVVAWRRGSVLELSTIVLTLFFYSMPIFWFALIMQWVFYAELGWFPIGTMGGYFDDGTPMHGITYVIDVLWHLVLPLVTLTMLHLAGTILLMRSSMLEVIGEDFITTAKAKGIKERRVVYRHAARNALLPVVTAMAMSIGAIISGGVLTETIFSWHGMGTLLVSATLQHDFPVVQGAFYILALITVLGNMGADILYAYLDPRVQL
jgi:peptide/nickel transport system permease protein